MKKIIDGLAKVQIAFSVVMLTVFLLCIVAQVATRYVPGFEASWTEEIANNSFIWATFMGSAVMVRRQGHFSFDFFRAKAKGVSKLIIELFINITMGAFGFYIASAGYELTTTFWNWNLTSLPSVSQRYTWSSLLVCGVTIVIYSLYNCWENYLDYKKEMQGGNK